MSIPEQSVAILSEVRLHLGGGGTVWNLLTESFSVVMHSNLNQKFIYYFWVQLPCPRFGLVWNEATLILSGSTFWERPELKRPELKAREYGRSVPVLGGLL